MHKIIELHIAGAVSGPDGVLLTVEEPDGTLTTLPPDEMEEYVANRRPKVYRGKTLDELLRPFPHLYKDLPEDRKMGLWDEELWANFSEEFKKHIETNWGRLEPKMKLESK